MFIVVTVDDSLLEAIRMPEIVLVILLIAVGAVAPGHEPGAAAQDRVSIRKPA